MASFATFIFTCFIVGILIFIVKSIVHGAAINIGNTHINTNGMKKPNQENPNVTFDRNDWIDYSNKHYGSK